MFVILFLYIDIDECALGLDDCGLHATCVNTVGSYKCKCMDDNFPLMFEGNCIGESIK